MPTSTPTRTDATAPAPAASRRTLVTRGLAAIAGLGLALTGVAVSAAPAHAAEPLATVLTYDASGAEEFTDAVDAGAQVWNEHASNVQFEPAEAGQTANVEVVATDGWPQTWTSSLGNGRVEMGREATAEGHDPIRIAAHELGHILGLPDMKPGPCSSLMSGASAGPECTNAIPNADEIAEVEANFGSGRTESSTTVEHFVYRD